METKNTKTVYRNRKSDLKNLSLIILILVLLLSNHSFSQKLVVGYYPDWLKTELPTSKIQFENLTHIIHSFAWPTVSGEIELYDGMLNANLNIKVHEAGKKILIAFGGAGQSQGFGPMVIDSTSRTNFISNLYNFLTLNNYDGIDIDWEFPENDLEKKGLTLLVKELRELFNENNPAMLISMAINSSHWGGQHFEFEEMEIYLDWFAMMGYDISGSWINYAGHNAPIFRGNNDWSWNDGYLYLNRTRNISNDKIVLGMPFYGKQFYSSDLYATHTDTVIDMHYNQIEEKIALENWDYFWDDETKVPYLLNSDRTKFITYDDTSAVKEKVKYALEKGVAGVMIWALGQDVIGDSQPLLEMIRKTLEAEVSVESEFVQLPNGYNLFNNFPNPFNPSTIIQYRITKYEHVQLKVYNSLGLLVDTLVNEKQDSGLHKIKFNSKNLSSGIYFYSLRTDSYSNTKGMILIK
jgi:chitinase